MSLSSTGVAVLFEHSEWFQPLFAELDRRGIPYDRLLAAELSYDPSARISEYALVVYRMSNSELGVVVLQPIADRDYGLRDFTVVTPDGIGLRFATRLPSGED